jgi:5'-deoxynucleotidase YfbR-like HD superfamily hydrolase
MTLGPAFRRALELMLDLHGDQRRKAGDIPYASHLLAVTAIVLEDGGSEDEAVAALLHDALEDAGGDAALARMREAGISERAIALVQACTETADRTTTPWRERKQGYLRALDHHDTAALRVALADKLHNARSLLADLRENGPDVWTRFTTGDPIDQLWWYRELADAFLDLHPGPLAEELDRTVSAIAVEAIGVPDAGDLRVWLDDDLVDRQPDAGWVHVTSAWEATALLGTGRVVELSLDHDLGEPHSEQAARVGTGDDVVAWLQRRARSYESWPADVRLHTASGAGRERMRLGIRTALRERQVTERAAGAKVHFEDHAWPVPPPPTPEQQAAFAASEIVVRLWHRDLVLRCGEPLPEELRPLGTGVVLTAHNPGDGRPDEAENLRRQRHLERTLAGLPHHRRAPAVGRETGPGGHAERSVAVWGLDDATTTTLAARYGQLAVFALDPAAAPAAQVRVVATNRTAGA